MAPPVQAGSSGEFPCNASLSLPGPAGPLEALTTCPAAGAARASALICHPHPLHGGSMQNKVVYMLARSFGELGLRTLRFNFRGVGASAGDFAQGAGEIDDALAALQWLRARRPRDEIWLAGFSFGAYVALGAAGRFGVTQLILVAPPVELYPPLDTPAPAVPTLILQGAQDDIVSAAGVADWAARQAPPPVLKVFDGAGHFFHGRLNDLRSAVHEALGPEVPAADA